MKLLLVLLIATTFACNVKAQDSASVDSKSMNKTTLTFQPIIGLGYLKGGTIGIGIKYNELIAVEMNYGLDFPGAIAYIFFFLPFAIDIDGRTTSQGIVVTPLNEKRISVSLYNITNYTTRNNYSNIDGNNHFRFSSLLLSIGWYIQLGDATNLRLSAGYALPYRGEFEEYGDYMIKSRVLVSMDIVFVIDAVKLSF